MYIDSGLGNGKQAGVDSDNRVLTASFNIPFQHLIAKDYEQTYVVQGEVNAVGANTGVLYMKNNYAGHQVVIHKLVLDTVGLTGGTALPAAATYFTLNMDSDYVSGGNLIAPSNLTSGSAKSASVTAYTAGFIGSGNQALKIFPRTTAQTQHVDDGSVILPPGKAFSIALDTDHTAGTAVALVEFSVVSTNGYSG